MGKVTHWALAAAVVWIVGCHRTEPVGIVEQTREAVKKNANGGVRLDVAALGIQAVPVEGVKTEAPFLVHERQSLIEKYPCSRCHTEPLAALQAKRTGDTTLSHWEIQLKHAPQSTMTCETCHGNGQMNELRTLAGQPVSFNASYRVCGQCHSKQLADWVGGAHGKRLGGWAPPRVAASCADCHNPHSPALGHRWPAQIAQQQEKH